MCKDDFPYYISLCCGAPAIKGFPKIKICSKCTNISTFWDKNPERWDKPFQ